MTRYTEMCSSCGRTKTSIRPDSYDFKAKASKENAQAYTNAMEEWANSWKAVTAWFEKEHHDNCSIPKFLRPFTKLLSYLRLF